MTINTQNTDIAHIREADGEQQSLEAHLLGVARLAGENAGKLGLGTLGELLGLLHDVGKASSRFQLYIKSAEGLIDQDSDDYVDAVQQKGKIDHSTAGAQWIWQALPETAAPLDVLCAQMLSLALASHHSGLIDCLKPDGTDNFTLRMEKSDRKTHLAEARAKFPEAVRRRVDELLEEPGLREPLKASLRKLRDQEKKHDPASGNSFGKARALFKTGLLLRMLFSCLIDADRTDTADFEKKRRAALRQKGKYVDWQTLADRLEAHLANFDATKAIDRERQKISDDCKAAAARDKGIHTLTVPTGGGKTLSSLRFALNHALHHGDIDRIFYVIPYTSIIDQNAEVVRRILEPPNEKGRVVLECHSNLTAEHETWRGKILSENWDAPVVFTTNVQFLEALFSGGTRSARRMHQLARSVVIFDEIQTLPIRTVHMFCNALNFLVEQCGTTAVLCTATQPLLDGVDESLGALSRAREIISRDLTELFAQFRRVEVVDRRRDEGYTCEEIAALALEEQKISGSVLVITNTTKIAREIYRCVKKDFKDTVHLSANMCPAHRKKVLKETRERLDASLPVVCVSTQVIEAGVDIDFGSGIRLLAGIDSAAQTSGRVNRHALRESGRVLLLNPSEEELGSLVDIRMGRDAARKVLNEFKTGLIGPDLLDPKIIAHYFEYYFYTRKDEMSYRVNAEREDTLLNMLSSNEKAAHDSLKKHEGMDMKASKAGLPQSFASAAAAFHAIDAPTRGVIVPHGGMEGGEGVIAKLCGAFDPEKDAALLRKAQQYSVNVYPHVWKKLDGIVKEVQKGADIWYLPETHYSSEFGLSEEPASTFGLACV
ncbi:MAG: CRISPR-associated helicase Cas3' [Synergistaceae bacterium]|jgi:CRISPR-associated endonuclease/helicase Cas3|nr:CRISPR-associated helicase Cas3' [Synergistaceae bacterium]